MRKLKIIFGILVLVMLFFGIKYYAGQTSAGKLKEGDLIFHTSKSEQSPLIQYATMSVLSHCGIIVEKSDGLYVLEASGKLKLTPLQEFIDRGKDRQWWAKRVIDKPVKVKYSHLLGRRYDTSFKPDNNLFYCSELIHHIYKTQFDIELCKYRKVSDYNLTGLKKKLKQRGINLDQEVVAPIDIYNSKHSHNV
ncbi:MAG: hypothetical protein IKQ77_00680 [Prevotella sp.]|jgi:hypothetical protein|nr:hypothetical protein [Prevotella sp.]